MPDPDPDPDPSPNPNPNPNPNPIVTLTLTLNQTLTLTLTLTRYLWDGTSLHSLNSQDTEWIHHSIRVFEGDFTDPRDLARIVDTCLGLSTCSKCPLWQRPSSPPVPPRGAPVGGPVQLGTPTERGPATGRPAIASVARASGLPSR